jgi:phosphate-selective porin OprO/OprP
MARHWNFRPALLAGVAAGTVLAGELPVKAADGAGSDPRGAQIDALERQVQDLARQIQDLKQQQARDAENQPVATAQVQDLKRSQSDLHADAQKPDSSQNTVSLANGRPTFTSADGQFTAAIRALGQFDSAYYSQGGDASKLPAAYGPDLSSGSNFRRAYLGVQGTAFGDWSYNANFDFGGNAGTELGGRVQSLYAQYDGLRPWGLRIGAYPPPANLEDSTSSGDTIFLERNAPSDLQRNIAGGDGRDAITIFYSGEELFGAASFTGGKVADAAVFDEQEGLLGRLSYRFHPDADTNLVIGANGTYVLKPADAVPHGSATLATTPGGTALNTITLSDSPELTVDSTGTKLVNTGALPASHLSQWGLEAAGNVKNFYAQAGYYAFDVERAPQAYKVFTSASASRTQAVKPDNNQFSGWYLQGSWVLTGEQRPYNSATASFGSPRPANPFSPSNGGIGAWELALRYSDLDLNDNVANTQNVITSWTGAANRTYSYYDTVRGGDQKIWTAGVNWYPNTAFRFALDYELIDTDRLQTPAAVTTTGTAALPGLKAGQTVQAIALRAQVGF